MSSTMSSSSSTTGQNLPYETFRHLDYALQDKRTCQTASDCALLYTDCPLSCGVVVARLQADAGLENAQQAIQFYIDNGGQQCQENCGTTGVTCTNSRCTPCGGSQAPQDCMFPPDVATFSTHR